MSGFWARTLVYLGLREEPEDHVEWDVLEAADPEAVVPAAPAGRTTDPRPSSRAADVRPVAPVPPRAVQDPVADVRPLRAAPEDGDGGRIAVVQLRVFDDVEAAARDHRDGRAVLLDVTAASAPDDRRAIDFLSGVVYASGGTLRRLTRGAFLLLPRGLELGPAQRERLERLGYVDAGGAR